MHKDQRRRTLALSPPRPGRARRPRAPASGFNGVGERGDDSALLLYRQLGINRQREDSISCSFRVRKITAPISERREALLQVERHGIVDLGANAAIIEE